MKKTAVMHRTMTQALPEAVAGEGVYVLDRQGRKYLDACGGAAVACLGYSNERVQRAIREQTRQLSYVHSSFFTTEAMEELADDLIAHAPGLDHFSNIYFVSGGSEAVEAALKLARQYVVEIGQPERQIIISRRQSYHGNTLGALSVSGNVARRAIYEPILQPGHHIAPCNPYRNRQADESLAVYGQRVANELETAIQTLGSQRVLAFIAETVGGATPGATPPVPGYFRRVREICDQYGVLLILDEVMCGMGRTGTLHACEQESVLGDLQTVAKGIAGGYQPLGAVFVNRRIAEAIQNGQGSFQHGHTYIGHAIACAAGLATQQEIRERGLLDNVKSQGLALQDRLRDRLGDHPCVGDIRGRGLFIGLELVDNKETQTPFAPELQLHKRIKTGAMARGLMCYPAGGTMDGIRGDHVLLAPPFIVETTHLEQIVDILAAVIDEETRAR